MSWVITPGQPVPIDLNRSNVSLLLHGDGTNGSTTITDSSPTPKTVTAFGDAQISTAQSKFGGASIAFDGTGDYATAALSSDFEFGTGNFTVETWIRFAAIGDRRIVGIGRGASGASPFLYTGWSLRSGSNFLSWYRFDGNETNVSRTWSPSADQWYHVAVSRSGASLRLFVDGSQLGATQSSSISYNSVNAEVLEIARFRSGAPAADSFLNGYVDDLRITKGIARYTANFTPPTAPFPDI
jgi:hypothetical protein